MEVVRRRALQGFLLLFVALIAALTLGVQLKLTGMLPVSRLGAVLLLLTVAFLAGSSLILRGTARAVHAHFAGERPASQNLEDKASAGEAILLFRSAASRSRR